jgi:hypothetical protein
MNYSNKPAEYGQLRLFYDFFENCLSAVSACGVYPLGAVKLLFRNADGYGTRY